MLLYTRFSACFRVKIFDNMALYFECRINKKHTPSDFFLAILLIENTWLRNFGKIKDFQQKEDVKTQ